MKRYLSTRVKPIMAVVIVLGFLAGVFLGLPWAINTYSNYIDGVYCDVNNHLKYKSWSTCYDEKLDYAKCVFDHICA